MIKNMYYYLTINYFNHEVIQPFMSLTILNITQFHMKDYYSFLLVSVPACFFTGKKQASPFLRGPQMRQS